MRISDHLTDHFRLTAPQKSALKRLNITTIQDLLYHFPARYDIPGESGTVAGLQHGAKITLYGMLSKVEAKRLWKSKRPAAEGWFEDGTGRIKVMWFNQPYLAKMVPQNVMVRLTGTVSGKDKPYITNPEVEPVAKSAVPENIFVDEKKDSNSLFPVYPESRGITSRWMYHALKKVFESGALKNIKDPIPDFVCNKYNLPDLQTALVWVHTPKTAKDATSARKRFSFEEIFVIQIARYIDRAENDKNSSFDIALDQQKIKTFVNTLPFPLTRAQKKSVGDIFSDFEKQHPMARLLEGDVGSGKTAVAAISAYAAVTSRPKGRNSGTLQVAYMAPTEILASQHFQSFIEFFKELPINIALITGSGCFKFPSKSDRNKPTPISRAQLLKWIANGEIAMLVGTHALIQKSVQFAHLAYVIVDEQHRFGTSQRKKLAHKGDPSTTSSQARMATRQAPLPHFLSMTATPIPRTLALTIYGDLDLSVLDELPAGRNEVHTTIVPKGKEEVAYKAIRKELESGRQAYVICPRINEPDPTKELALRVKSAKSEAARLKKEVFPEYEIGLLHSKLNQKEKDSAMRAFVDGKTNILVATSVVEVGVNVPNATVILIEGSERFGLAQLHQLRGRVRRSVHKAYCFLATSSASQASNERLKAVEKTMDGFALAEEDLKLRGAGDLYGKSQWGMSDLGMEALKNPRLINVARESAHTVVEKNTINDALQNRLDRTIEQLHQE
jgi:ATP-dependent DNA helicase RecG